MKAINIKSYKEIDNNYEFTLGNGAQHIFSSKKKLDAFINKKNKDLTRILYDVNILWYNSGCNHKCLALPLIFILPFD